MLFQFKADQDTLIMFFHKNSDRIAGYNVLIIHLQNDTYTLVEWNTSVYASISNGAVQMFNAAEEM